MGVKFPAAKILEEVKKGREPVSQTVMSFFADPGFDEMECTVCAPRRRC